jgi:hypothetical protein
MNTDKIERDNGILFFILIYLLLFYDNSCIGILSRGYRKPNTCRGGSSSLFFILDFLLLFYK